MQENKDFALTWRGEGEGKKKGGKKKSPAAQEPERRDF